MELRGYQGNGGYRRGRGTAGKYEHFKHIIGQRAEAMSKGVTEEEISSWVEELSKANRSVACADPDLAAMETEQVEKGANGTWPHRWGTSQPISLRVSTGS